jgi:hypothetical protein
MFLEIIIPIQKSANGGLVNSGCIDRDRAFGVAKFCGCQFSGISLVAVIEASSP